MSPAVAEPSSPSKLASILASLMPHLSRDGDDSLLCGRAGDEAWPADESWVAFLAALPVEDVEACERHGLHRVNAVVCRAPSSLHRLCEAVSTASAALGRRTADVEIEAAGGTNCTCSFTHRGWRQSAAKTAQVGHLVANAASRIDLTRVRRVVDVGCGKGHLLSRLRAELGVPALGIDVDEGLLATGRATYPEIEAFECRDVVASGLPCAAGDLVVGLHPCGALGEAITCAVCEQQGECSLIMVPCCWHKQGADACARDTLSQRARAAGLHLPRAALKKASMALDSTASVHTRRQRYALRELLRGRGVDEAELLARREMDGIHPKKASRGLDVLGAEALRLRGMPPATEEELMRAAERSTAPFERDRRLSLLEPVLGELVELSAFLDRAMALEEGGLSTQVSTAFGRDCSDRNLCITAGAVSAPV